MPNIGRITIIAAAAVGAFALLLLIISVGTVSWLDDGNGNTVGLFRECFANNTTYQGNTYGAGCTSQNRVTQGGLSVFGLLLLAFGVMVIIASIFVEKKLIIVLVSLGLVYFSSMFVMAAYATWGVYSRDPDSYFFPISGYNVSHTSLGASYNLCVASHYFLWTALTALAFGAGYIYHEERHGQST